MACLRVGWELIKDQYWIFLGMAFVGIFLGSMAPMGILLGPMMCALHLAFFRRSRGEVVQFTDLGKGFDYFGQSLIATLLQILPLMIILMPVYLIGMFTFLALMARSGRSHHAGSPADFLPIFGIFGLTFVIVFAASLIVGAFFLFTYPLIVDKKMSGVDAVKTSIRAAFGNLAGVLGLTCLLFGLGIAGLLFCYVGTFLVMPLGLAARHVAYKQVFRSF